MITLRVIVDEAADAASTDVGRYAEELTREIIATRPDGSEVAAVVPSTPEEDRRLLEARLPGLADLHVSPLTRGQLAATWQRGITPLPGRGIVHATSLLAPLRRHDRVTTPGSQIAVTIHDAIAWTDPALLPPRTAAWARAMGRRAERHADAVVVPTHAVADELAEHLDLGDRVRVIGGAPGSRLGPVADAAERRRRLGIPHPYAFVVADGAERTGVLDLMSAVGRLDGLALVVAGAGASRDELLTAGSSAAAPVFVLGALGAADLSAVYQGAAVYVQPSIAEGFGLALLDAFAFDLPVVHTDVPALTEVAAGAGREVALDDRAGLPERLAHAIDAILRDPDDARRLGIAGQDRARAFTWRDAAEKVWQLHADL